jgi:hypothetical protein
MTAQHRFPATVTATAFGLPVKVAIERILQSARELNQSADKVAKEHEQHGYNNFGRRIAAAVTNKLRPRAAIVASASGTAAPPAEAESFGQRIAQAVKDRLTGATHPPTVLSASTTQPSIPVSADGDGDEGFAQRLKEAAERRSGSKRHKEYAERERERYEQQRKRAMGE